MVIGDDASITEENPESLRQVCWNRLSEPTSLWNCLGKASREMGQSRVPAPPQRINGEIRCTTVFPVRCGP